MSTEVGGLTAGIGRRARRARRAVLLRTVDRLDRDPIVVYSLPKTGTSALGASLLSPRLLRPVHQVHMLSNGGLAAGRTAHEAGSRIRAEKLRAMETARAAIDDPDRRPLVVTVVRHPLPRAVSWYFQSWAVDFPWALEVEPDDAVDELVQGFHERLPLAVGAGDRWFENELGTVLEHDALTDGIPHEPGWMHLRLDRADLLMTRTEDLSRTYGPMCRAALGSAPPLRRVNVAEDKPYAALRRSFLTRVRLGDDELDLIASSRVARHLYRPADTAAALDALGLGAPR